MPIDTLTANHIGAVGGGYEIQRQNNALLYVVGLDGNSNDVLTLSLQSFPLPKVSSGIIEVPFVNEKRKFAGAITYDDLTIVFNDYVDRPTAEVLFRWRYSVQNPDTGAVGYKRDYAKEGRMVKFGPDGTADDREWELRGIWPSTMDAGEVDFAGEDAVKINMTLTIDTALYLPSTAA